MKREIKIRLKLQTTISNFNLMVTSTKKLSTMTSLVGDDGVLEGEGFEGDSLAPVELVLELDPVEPEGVQEGRQTFHRQQNGNRQRGEESV